MNECVLEGAYEVFFVDVPYRPKNKVKNRSFHARARARKILHL